MAARELARILVRQAKCRAERPVYEIICRDPKRAEEIRAMGFAVDVAEAA